MSEDQRLIGFFSHFLILERAHKLHAQIFVILVKKRGGITKQKKTLLWIIKGDKCVEENIVFAHAHRSHQ